MISKYANSCGVYRSSVFVTYLDLLRAVDLAKATNASTQVISAIDQALDTLEKCAREIKEITGESPIEMSKKYVEEFEELMGYDKAHALIQKAGT